MNGSNTFICLYFWPILLVKMIFRLQSKYQNLIIYLWAPCSKFWQNQTLVAHLQSFSTSATGVNSKVARNTPKHTDKNSSASETAGIISLHLNHNIIKKATSVSKRH